MKKNFFYILYINVSASNHHHVTNISSDASDNNQLSYEELETQKIHRGPPSYSNCEKYCYKCTYKCFRCFIYCVVYGFFFTFVASMILIFEKYT